MYPTRSPLALGLALLAGGCSSVSVTTDYDMKFDFALLRTFGWPPKTQTERIDQLDLDRITSAVKRSLEAKGFTVSANPDFLVSLHGDRHARIDVQGWGYHSGWYAPGTVDAYEVQESVLVIDIVDAAQNKMVWRGSGTRKLDSDPTPEEATKSIDETVDKILAPFPPTKH